MNLDYEIVDVFTEEPYGGNPLAVVADADALSGAQMQAIAREFNLSETIFVLPATQPEAAYRVRIFTPTHELRFAGHPSIGAAVTLLRQGRIAAGEFLMECGAGLVRVRADDHGRGEVDGGAPRMGERVDAGALARAVGLTERDLLGPAPRIVETGVDFPYLTVTEQAVTSARPPTSANFPVVSVLSWNASTQHAHARVFLPGYGITEDPASGLAALGLGVWLVDAGLLPGNGTQTYRISQGAELGRPSTLDCTVTAVNGTATATTVAGHVAPVATGRISPPPPPR